MMQSMVKKLQDFLRCVYVVYSSVAGLFDIIIPITEKLRFAEGNGIMGELGVGLLFRKSPY